MSWIDLAAIFFAGLLAGEEFVIRFGVRSPLARLERQAHVEIRQGLIRSLRVLVPILFFLALLSGIAAAIQGWSGPTAWSRGGSVALLLGFIAVTLTGTVPINKAVLSWDARNPPAGWEDAVRRWERLDDVRTALAIGAFVLALVGAGG